MRARILRHRFLYLSCGIFIAGLLAGYWGYVQARDSLRSDLIHDAERAAAAIDATETARLTGTIADLSNPTYEAVKSRLIRYRGADDRVRFVHVFRVRPDSHQVIFLMDSESPDSVDISLPGEKYPETRNSPGLQAILLNGLPATEGPITDTFGTWVTGYALVARDTTGQVREVLGVDMAAKGWWWQVWSAAAKATISVWLLCGLSLAGYSIVRRQHEQHEVIRNLSEAIEQSHTAVMIIDLQGRIEYANAGFCQQVGSSRRDLIGRSWGDFMKETTPVETAMEIIAIFNARRNWTGEWENKRKDDTTYPVRGMVTAVRNRQNKVTCFVAIYQDVSAMRRNEMILLEAKDRAEAGDRAKSQFLATMSHEVRTPLNGIIGFTNLLLETPLNAEQEEYMRTIRSSGEALIQLTNDILDSARIETGKLKLELLSCDPRECIEDAFDIMATPASDKKLELLYWVEDSLPEFVLTDPSRLRQVLLNLVNNAVKFTEVGEVMITLSGKMLGKSEDPLSETWELKFAVRDTGIGIEESQYEKLFRPFSQLEESNTRRFSGTGLGLAISSNLVQMMGGKIGLDSEMGVGSTFTFTIKAKRVARSDSKPTIRPHNLAGLRLAIAGQPGVLRQEISRLGERWGTKVTTCTAEELPGLLWDAALVNMTEAKAEKLINHPEPRPNLPREKMIAMVPLGLTPASRAALRPHFRLLVNKPVHHEALRSALATPTAPNPKTLSSVPASSFDLQVLLVEDNPVNQRLMQKVLGHLGCHWAVAENGRIALDELKRKNYHIVLMDLHMPEMDGYTAIKHIRAGDTGKAMQQVWITALTADARVEQKERVLAAGANDYLLKPVRLKDLEALLIRFVAYNKEQENRNGDEGVSI